MEELRALSRQLHDKPETAMRETQAAAWLTDYLEKNSFTVERGTSDLPTKTTVLAKPLCAYASASAITDLISLMPDNTAL